MSRIVILLIIYKRNIRKLGFRFARPEQVAALRRYGELVGMAFQIVDDLLDYTGKGAETGKELGNDFREGKLTLPLLRALAAAGPDERQAMRALIAGDRS